MNLPRVLIAGAIATGQHRRQDGGGNHVRWWWAPCSMAERQVPTIATANRSVTPQAPLTNSIQRKLRSCNLRRQIVCPRFSVMTSRLQCHWGLGLVEPSITSALGPWSISDVWKHPGASKRSSDTVSLRGTVHLLGDGHGSDGCASALTLRHLASADGPRDTSDSQNHAQTPQSTLTTLRALTPCCRRRLDHGSGGKVLWYDGRD
jgi:hypothetical protein